MGRKHARNLELRFWQARDRTIGYERLVAFTDVLGQKRKGMTFTTSHESIDGVSTHMRYSVGASLMVTPRLIAISSEKPARCASRSPKSKLNECLFSGSVEGGVNGRKWVFPEIGNLTKRARLFSHQPRNCPYVSGTEYGAQAHRPVNQVIFWPHCCGRWWYSSIVQSRRYGRVNWRLSALLERRIPRP